MLKLEPWQEEGTGSLVTKDEDEDEDEDGDGDDESS